MSLWGLLSEHRAEDGGVCVCNPYGCLYMSFVCLKSVCVCVKLTGVTEERPIAPEVADIQRSVSLLCGR